MTFEEYLKSLSPEHKALVEGAIEKAKADSAAIAVAPLQAELEKAKADMATANDEKVAAQADAKKKMDELAQLKKSKEEGAEGEEAVIKSLPPEAQAILEKARVQSQAAEEMVKKMKEEQDATFIKSKTAEFAGLPTEEVSAVLKSLYGKDEAGFEAACTVMKSASELITKSAAFGEVGKSNDDSQISKAKDAAWSVFNAEVQAVAKAKSITTEAATVDVMKSKPELYQAYVNAME